MRGVLLCACVCALASGCDDDGEVDRGGMTADGATDPDVRVAPDAAEPDADAAEPDDDAQPPDADAAVRPDGGGDCVQLASGACVVETFRNPPVLQPDEDGVHTLVLGPAEVEIAGERHCVRAYNGVYPGPTLETPARDGEARSIRINLVNRFTDHDYQDLNGDETCTCTSGDDASCVPDHIHDPCVGEGDTCTCANAEGAPCDHMYDFNTTNLHAHGGHLRPDYARGGERCMAERGDGGPLRCRECGPDTCDGDARDDACFLGDDVLSVVHPGEGAQYRWDIDEDGTHHAGTQWYHPHIHGTTAIQVASGAAGAWIVRGEEDALPGLADARERIMVLMTPPIGTNGFQPLAEDEACTEDTLTFNDFGTLIAREAKQLNIVNGLHTPRLLMPPGQIERWRLVNGSFIDESIWALARGADDDCASWDADDLVPLTQIARDGLTLRKPEDGDGWPYAPEIIFMSSGYRIDAILDGGALAHGDTLCLVSTRFLQARDSSQTNGPVGETPLNPDDLRESIEQGSLVAIVNVTEAAGEPSETEAPDLDAVAALAPGTMLADGSVDALARCEEAVALTDPEEIDQLAIFQVGFTVGESGTADLCGCYDHNVNCRSFGETDRAVYPVDRAPTLGAVEHWRVQAYFDGHPFHIHINPFLVCPLPPEGSGAPNEKSRLIEPPFAHWRDTYMLNLDRTLDAITEYKSYAGPYVFHCHKLTHEDHGMMQLVSICDPEVEDCDQTCGDGPCGWQHCAEGDLSCQREVAATKCIANPNAACVEANVRCAQCDEMPCPPGAWCDEEASRDGARRCIPGCRDDADCADADRCEAGQCAPAPCAPPCRPGQRCVHGVCE